MVFKCNKFVLYGEIKGKFYFKNLLTHLLCESQNVFFFLWERFSTLFSLLRENLIFLGPRFPTPKV